MRHHIVSILTILMALASLSGCENSKAPLIGVNAALDPDTSIASEASSYTIDVSSDEISALIDSKASFIVYIGNDYCSSCTEFQPAFRDYILETGLLVYHYDNIDNDINDYNQLVSRYPSIFSDNPFTPSLLFFKQGEMRTRQNGQTRMFDIATLRPIMESYATVVDIQIIHDAATFARFSSEGTFLAYDRSDDGFADFYHEELLSAITSQTLDVMQLEISLDADLNNDVSALVGAAIPTLFTIEQGAIINSISFDGTNGPELLTWLNAQAD
jgi:hypothetical protein